MELNRKMYAEAKAKMESLLHKWGIKNRYAFTALLIGGIMAIMIGAVRQFGEMKNLAQLSRNSWS